MHTHACELLLAQSECVGHYNMLLVYMYRDKVVPHSHTLLFEYTYMEDVRDA